MSKCRKKISFWERYLTKEIGIELKACLYFFCILLFYSVYKMLGGSYEANIIHMAEMIFLTYAMGYLQVYLLSNFDEAEELTEKEIINMFFCSFLYAVISILGKWFDGNVLVSIGFAFYMLFAYVCVFLIYKLKREIDEKILNEDLKAFQERRKKNEECDRN